MNWPALLPDPATSRVVMVAARTFHRLPALPQAQASVEQLIDALCGPDGLLDRSQVHAIVDPQTPAAVLAPLAEAASTARGLLLFCYVGHGVRGAGGRLHFALPGTIDDPEQVARTSLSADAVFGLLGGAATSAVHRVAVLDCCFAGLALDVPDAAGVHLLMAADRARKALIPEDSATTGFTAELLRIVREGVPDGPEYLDLTLLHRRLAVALAQVPKGAPAGSRPPNPGQRTVDASGDLALARNRAYGTGRSREGLKARARFAYRVAAIEHLKQPWRAQQGATLLAGIVADARLALGERDRDVLLFRHAHASVSGTAAGPEAAVRLLTPLLAEMCETLQPDDPAVDAVRSSLDHWTHLGTGQ